MDKNYRKKHIRKHAQFLAEVYKELEKLQVANPEIFRRKPDMRIKTISSLDKKLNRLKKNEANKSSSQIQILRSVDDIAGARLTICTKDQHEKARELLEKSLEHLGELYCARQNGAEMDSNGYAANHFVLKKEGDLDVKCEIQVRTLTQDLWAVFSHYELYKSEDLENDVLRKDELLNYARLMDVSDYYATLILKRKIEEAEEFHRNAIRSKKGKSQLDKVVKEDDFPSIDKLGGFFEKITNDGQPKERIPEFEKIDTLRLCKFLKELSSYEIYSMSQIKSIASKKVYTDYIAKRVNQNIIKYDNINRDYVTRITGSLINILQQLHSINSKGLSEYIRSFDEQVNVFKQKITDRLHGPRIMDTLSALVILCSVYKTFNNEYEQEYPQGTGYKPILSLIDQYIEDWESDSENMELVDLD